MKKQTLIVHVFEVFFIYVFLDIQRYLARVALNVYVLLEILEQSGCCFVELLAYLFNRGFGEEAPSVVWSNINVFGFHIGLH